MNKKRYIKFKENKNEPPVMYAYVEIKERRIWPLFFWPKSKAAIFSISSGEIHSFCSSVRL